MFYRSITTLDAIKAFMKKPEENVLKCSQCGHWNRSTFDKCMKCGQTLQNHDAQPVRSKLPDWQYSVKSSAAEYVHVDEDGETQVVPDTREAMAKHIAELKIRKVKGEQRQRVLRSEGSQKESLSAGLQIKKRPERTTFFTFDPYESSRISNPVPIDSDTDNLPVFNSIDDSGALDILFKHADTDRFLHPRIEYKKVRIHRMGFMKLIRAAFILLICAVVAISGYLIHLELTRRHEERSEALVPIISASMLNDMAAHTVLIPGQEGTMIYIRELRLSYEVMDGYASIEVPDHYWYDEHQGYLHSTVTATLTPFQKLASGQQQPLPVVTYEVEIPLSKIELLSPDISFLEVAVMMYTLRIRVQENSIVHINDKNVTDMINLDGEITYNATVQPIGDNVFTISVKSQYCRENIVSLILYRAKQEIPLDLASDTSQRSSRKEMQITATTIPGSIVNVLTPHTDLDITSIDSKGTFTFYAVFSAIGYNTITITADYPGRKQSIINHEVYYVPPASEYTRKAWDVFSQYADLLANNAMRSAQTQIYVCKGTIERIVSEKPQLAVMNIGTSDQARYILIENNTRDTWYVGAYYRVYADAFGMYDDMPRLQARYTYLD
ncbi:MAG: hypothetical protein FWF47_04280 [Clostridia bacterium]|nr:hypothetical protein [Clostridia bacterium]